MIGIAFMMCLYDYICFKYVNFLNPLSNPLYEPPIFWYLKGGGTGEGGNMLHLRVFFTSLVQQCADFGEDLRVLDAKQIKRFQNLQGKYAIGRRF